MMNEVWKSVVGYEGLYEVSDIGNVRKANNSAVYKLQLSHRGYFRINLTKNKKIKGFMVHRLVAAAFIGPIPDQVDHINGCKTDNRVSNLRFCNNSENNWNKKKPIKGTSQYKGVHIDTSREPNSTRRWVAKLKKDNKIVFKKRFETEHLAAIAYNEAAKEHYGDYAVLNVIDKSALEQHLKGVG